MNGNDEKKEDQDKELADREDIEKVKSKTGLYLLVVLNTYFGISLNFVDFSFFTKPREFFYPCDAEEIWKVEKAEDASHVDTVNYRKDPLREISLGFHHFPNELIRTARKT